MNSRPKPLFAVLAVLFGLGLVISALTNGQQHGINPELVRSATLIENTTSFQNESR